MVEKVIIRAVNIIRDKDMNNRLLLVLLCFKCPMLAVKDTGISQNLKSIKGELILSFRRLKDDVPFFNNFVDIRNRNEACAIVVLHNFFPEKIIVIRIPMVLNISNNIRYLIFCPF